MTSAYPWPHELGTASPWEADSNERAENEKAEAERDHADDEESRALRPLQLAGSAGGRVIQSRLSRQRARRIGLAQGRRAGDRDLLRYTAELRG